MRRSSCVGPESAPQKKIGRLEGHAIRPSRSMNSGGRCMNWRTFTSPFTKKTSKIWLRGSSVHFLKNKRHPFGAFTGIDTGGQSIVRLAIDDSFRKVVLRVFKDSFRCRGAREFEVGTGTARLWMRDVVNCVCPLLDPQILKLDGLIAGNRAAHA